MDWAANRSDSSQHIPLLTTKLQIPRIRTDLVARARLYEAIDEGLRSKLTIVSAPAGFGKTTLLASWAQRRKQHTAWISLDPTDNTPAQFWSYLIGSLQSLKPGIGTTSMDLLSSGQQPFETVLVSLINELAAITDEMVLVLDDYHLIDTPSIHSTLTFFIERMPAQLHLFLASRIDPPLPLTRLRARAELIEISMSDLRFTFQETTAFLNGILGEQLPAEEVAELVNGTEGWITGLQLVALSMQRRKRIDSAAKAIEGAHRYIDDYLSGEVLEGQPRELRTFLLHTSILDRMCGALCDAVTGERNGGQMLERLEDANLFIIPLDEHRQWYRYHTLFAGVLRDRLRQEQPELVAELHAHASQWYENHGFMQEAVEHLMKGGDMDRAVRLAEQHAESLLSNGELEPLLRWIRLFPDDQIATRPRLAIAFAWALLLNGQVDDVEKYLQYCRRSIQSDPTRGLTDISGHLATVGSFLKNFDESGDQVFRHADAASVRFQAMRDRYSGVEPEAHGHAQDAAAPMLPSGRFGVLESLPHVAQLQIKMGQLTNAAETCQQALKLAEQGVPNSNASQAAATANLGLAETHFERNELDIAMQDVAEGIRLGRNDGDAATVCDSYILLAKIHQARGDLDGALDALDEAEQLQRRHNLGDGAAGLIAAHRVRVWLAQGNLQAAAQWSQKWKLDWMARPTDVDETQVLMLARVFIAQYRSDEALELLAPVLSAAEAKGWVDTIIRALVLQSLALDQQGDSEQAVTILARSLKLAERERYIRIFISEGAPMIRLLLRVREARQNGDLDSTIAPALEYVNGLLVILGVAPGAVLENEPKVEKSHSSNGSNSLHLSPNLVVNLPTPLSEREVEVLRLIAEGKSNSGIADSLYISVSTVKTHINNLYSKLGVETRTQALARAREYHLL
jgi:LuxR family maltose regulon positive regulatory protein